MEVINVPVRDLIPYEKNAKNHPDDQIEHIANSIREFGFRQPLVIDAQNVVVIGHGRLMAAKKLGMEEVPCVRADDLSETQIKALRLADNKTNESEWDFDALEHELDELSVDFDMSDFGFDAFQVEEEPQEAQEDDFDVDAPVEAKAKLGDIYKLGRHRLMCGDSTSHEDIETLMSGEKADMVFTDPPYKMKAQDGSNQWVGRCAAKLGERIKDMCDFNPDEFLKRLKEIFSNGMNAYIFCNKDLVPDYLNWAIDSGYSFNILFWKKPSALPLGGQHRPDTEYLLFFRKNAIWNNGLSGATYSKCLEFSRDNSTDHPTMKPLGLIVNELKISSVSNSIVVDFFGGSGSTLIACEQINRTCYMMELDPHYVDVIIARWEQFTGQKAVLLNR